MQKKHCVTNKPLLLSDIEFIISQHSKLELSTEAVSNIVRCRNYLDEKISSSTEPIYGINTGFGSLYHKNISPNKLKDLQSNLVMSHACGVGQEIHHKIVLIMLFLKIQSLSYGYSGVQLQTVQHLIELFNHRALPKVYEMGSLGASGDLVPLAHLSLPLIGLGEVHYKGKTHSGKELLALLGLSPIRFKAKEGLALLNGTQFMGAYGVCSLLHAHHLFKLANYISALSLDSFDGCIAPFDELVHRIRPHPGQVKVAQEIRRILNGSEMIAQPKKHVQDPYSFRCVPQVHGASWDVIDFASKVFIIEINSTTDNPNCFPDENKIISAGNFHGQPLAQAMDFLAMGLAELGSIAERRTYQLLSGKRNLPDYLIEKTGINSGLMVLQYTAASLVSQNKQLCTPASIDSIVSSNGQEDHVSMGANAATKLYRVVENTYAILAIEMIVAAQALHFKRPLKTSPILEEFVGMFRRQIPIVEKDRVFYEDIATAEKFLKEIKLNQQCM